MVNAIFEILNAEGEKNFRAVQRAAIVESLIAGRDGGRLFFCHDAGLLRRVGGG